MKTWLIRTAVGGVILVMVGGVAFFGYFELVKRNWIRYNQYDIRSEGILQVGDPAPDLALTRVGGEGPIQFSSLDRQRPLVLVFGSYT